MIVMGFVLVLAVLASAFAINMKVEAILARNAKSEADVEWLCRSGVELAKYILSSDMANNQEQPWDSLNETWAGGSGDTNGINPLLNTLSLTNAGWAPNTVLGLLFPEEDPGPGVRCKIEIIDLERKYNINRAAPRTIQQQAEIGRWPLKNAFVLMGIDTSLHDYLTDGILDWCDVDDDHKINGAESDYYQSLTPPYSAKNGPIDDLKELLLIRNITPKMYWGNRTNQLANSALTASPIPTAEEEDEDEPDYPVGLVDLYTPISVGYININTASLEVLQLLDGMDENRAAFIINLRNGFDGIPGTVDDEPFSTITGQGPLIPGTRALSQVPSFQTSAARANAARFMSISSATFQVTVTAQMRSQTRTLIAVLSRKSPTEIPILYTYWK